jgi:hypothetical protein
LLWISVGTDVVCAVVCKVLPKLVRVLPNLSAQNASKPGETTKRCARCGASVTGTRTSARRSSEVRLRVIYKAIHLTVRRALTRRFISIVL